MFLLTKPLKATNIVRMILNKTVFHHYFSVNVEIFKKNIYNRQSPNKQDIRHIVENDNYAVGKNQPSNNQFSYILLITSILYLTNYSTNTPNDTYSAFCPAPLRRVKLFQGYSNNLRYDF